MRGADCNDQLLKYSAFMHKFIWASLWMVKINFKKYLIQTECCMSLLKQMAGKVDVTAIASIRRPPVSLEYQILSGWHFSHKIIVE